MNKSVDVRWLFAQPCAFVAGAPQAEVLQLPPLPEVAFVGRSNVGKSSLINALVNRKQLARTSNTPGRTQQINFFNLGDQILLVDLPGYGYAKVPQNLARSWQYHMTEYVMHRRNLVCLYVLIDARHGCKEIDFQMFDILYTSGTPFQVVLTKADKIGKQDLEQLQVQVLEQLSVYTTAYPEVLITSSKDRSGLDTVQRCIAGFVCS